MFQAYYRLLANLRNIMSTYKITIFGREEPLYIEADTEQEALALSYNEIELYGKCGDIEQI
jgi:hypothetical protein